MSAVHRYHDGTKHHFNRFASSLGYLDWASQPNPFRTYAGAPRVPLFPAPGVSPDYKPQPLCYERLFDRGGDAEPSGQLTCFRVLLSDEIKEVRLSNRLTSSFSRPSA